MSRIDIACARSARYLEIRRWRGGPEWHPRPHAHPFCELIIVLAGTERVLLEETEILCGVGEVLFYKPGVLHSEWQEGSTLLEFYCFEFEWPDCPPDFPRQIQDLDGRLLEMARWLNVDRLYNTRAIHHAYRELLTHLLVVELLRLVVTPRPKSIDVIRKYVRENISAPLNLDMLGEACGMNKFHMVRQFRSATGLTPMEYVRLVRLDLAFHLLAETGLPLREIAARTGLASEYHLSRLIKQRYGHGARELRRSFHSGNT